MDGKKLKSPRWSAPPAAKEARYYTGQTPNPVRLRRGGPAVRVFPFSVFCRAWLDGPYMRIKKPGSPFFLGGPGFFVEVNQMNNRHTTELLDNLLNLIRPFTTPASPSPPHEASAALLLRHV